MANKQFIARLQQKHDLEVNWLKAKRFVPIAAELIVYDAEIDAEGNILALPEGRTEPYSYARIKIGDGHSNISDLPFVNQNDAETILENLVGQKTEDGGEIFNDYENNVAIGEGSSVHGQSNWAGTWGFDNVKAEGPSEGGELVLTISKDVPNVDQLQVGDVVSILGTNKYNDFGAISQINPPSEWWYAWDIYINDCDQKLRQEIIDDPKNTKLIIYVAEKPEVGSRILTEEKGQFIAGVNNKALQYGAAAFGYGNTAAGRYSFASGIRNTAGHDTAVFGSDNEVNGVSSFGFGWKNTMPAGKQNTGSFVGGRDSKVDAQYAMGMGRSISVVNDCQTAVGKWNEEEVDSLFVVGNGENDINRSTAFKVNEDGTAIIKSQGEADNAVAQKQYVDNAVDGKLDADQYAYNDIVMDEYIGGIVKTDLQYGVGAPEVAETQLRTSAETYGLILGPVVYSSETKVISLNYKTPTNGGLHRFALYPLPDGIDFDTLNVTNPGPALGGNPINGFDKSFTTSPANANELSNIVYDMVIREGWLEDNKNYVLALMDNWSTKCILKFKTETPGMLKINAATEAEIDEGINEYKPIVPANVKHIGSCLYDGLISTSEYQLDSRLKNIHIGDYTETEDSSGIKMHMTNEFRLSGSYVHILSGSGGYDSDIMFTGSDVWPLSWTGATPPNLGTSNYPWSTVYATNGTIQTSARDAKENIKTVASATTPMVMSLDDTTTELSDITSDTVIDFVRNLQPVTFNYKGSDTQESKQLGLIADDIAEHDIYKYIGINRTETVEIEPAEYDEEGNVIKEAVTEEKQVLGLQALPLVTASLAACKELVNKNDILEMRVTNLEDQLAELKEQINLIKMAL